MIDPVESPHRVPFDGSFRVADAPTGPPEDFSGKKESKARLKELVDELDELQRVLYAEDRDAILLVFQAMDAAGKDGTIRAVLRGVNPAGCQVFSFKQPSPLDLDHDFLWRTTRLLPERGLIGIFNRSYYEEVLIVRVHPDYLEGQTLVELKSTRLGLGPEEVTQIEDDLLVAAARGTVTVEGVADPQTVSAVRLVFSNIEGARGASEDLARWLRTHANFTIEVFGSNGAATRITRANLGELQRARGVTTLAALLDAL